MPAALAAPEGGALEVIKSIFLLFYYSYYNLCKTTFMFATDTLMHFLFFFFFFFFSFFFFFFFFFPVFYFCFFLNSCKLYVTLNILISQILLVFYQIFLLLVTLY